MGWAASYPLQASGFDILAAVNADGLLQSHACDILSPSPTTFPLPQSFKTCRVSDQPVLQPHHQRQLLILLAFPIKLHQSLQWPLILVNKPKKAQCQVPVLMKRIYKGLTIFGLAQISRHCFVRWTTYNGILLDILQTVGLPGRRSSGLSAGWGHSLAVCWST